jgi:glycosyltransferase involved in cell wall biosynthesis
VRAVPIAVRGDGDVVAIWKLCRLMQAHAADIVCVNTFRELKVGGVAARLARRGRVVNRRGAIDALENGRRERLLYRWLLDMVIRDSQAGCRAIREENAWFRRPVLQSRNGVAVAALAAVRPAERAALGALPTEVLIASIDRPGRWEGSLDVAAAARLAVEQRTPDAPPMRLVVIGQLGAATEAELRAYLAGRESHVRLSLLGSQSPADTLRIIAACDILTRVSRTDGLSYAVLEAMALGVPVIASHIGGLPEMVVDGATGRLVPPGDRPRLAAALAALAADPAQRRRMGAAGRERVRREFSEQRMLDEYEAAFRVAIAQGVHAVKA